MILACILIVAIDGDTLRALCPEPLTIRIADIDAPELRACPAAGAASRTALAAAATGPLTVTPRYTDRYGRTVATVTARGVDLAAAQVAAGHARPWPHDARGRPLAPRPRGC